MRRSIFVLLLQLAAAGAVLAQSPVIVQPAGEAYSERLKTSLYYLTSDQLEGRLMASHGDTLASRFVSPLVFMDAGTVDSFFLSLAYNLDSFRSVLSHAGVKMLIVKHPGFDANAAFFKAHDFLPRYADSLSAVADNGVPVFALSEQRFNELTPGSTVSAQ